MSDEPRHLPRHHHEPVVIETLPGRDDATVKRIIDGANALNEDIALSVVHASAAATSSEGQDAALAAALMVDQVRDTLTYLTTSRAAMAAAADQARDV